jgi:hypothetical protein
MKLFRTISLSAALGALMVAGGLLGGVGSANAQGAPPGFFQVPGTNTALLITGQVGVRMIYDNNSIQDSPAFPGVESDVLIPLFIPISNAKCPSIGTCNGINGAGPNSAIFHFSSQDYSLGFITSTPTPYGDLGTVLIFGAGNDVFQDFGPVGLAFHATGLVVGFGTLGPFMAGMNASLFGDADASPDTFQEPLALAGQVGGLNPSFRYTWKGPNGVTIAGSIEAPFTSNGATGALVGNFENSLLGANYPAGAGFGPDNVFSVGTLNGAPKVPDFVLKARWDQPWGHIAIAGILHQNTTNCTLNCNPLSNFQGVGGDPDGITAPAGSQAATAAFLYGAQPAGDIPNLSRMGWGVNLTGHLNTWGKDAFKWGVFGGQGLGSYMGDYGDTGIYAQVCTFGSPNLRGPTCATPVFTGAAYIPSALGGYLSYQHFWTDQLRSTVGVGGSHVFIRNNMINNVFIENEQMDETHWSIVANLIWSPVPKVDLGLQYIYYHVLRSSAAFAGSAVAIDNRLEAGALFHF